MRNADPVINTRYWLAQSADADNQVTQSLLGNNLTTLRSYDVLGRSKTISTGAGSLSTGQDLSYVFDSLGNLRLRRDDNQTVAGGTQVLSETFGYDSLNRLTSNTVTGYPVANASYTYDTLGNLLSKTDIGTYTYGAGSAGPHAVTSTAGPHTATYNYDLNGNQRSGAGRSLAYTSFNVPRIIIRNGSSTTFTYDPEYGRTTQLEQQTGQPPAARSTCTPARTAKRISSASSPAVWWNINISFMPVLRRSHNTPCVMTAATKPAIYTLTTWVP